MEPSAPILWIIVAIAACIVTAAFATVLAAIFVFVWHLREIAKYHYPGIGFCEALKARYGKAMASIAEKEYARQKRREWW